MNPFINLLFRNQWAVFDETSLVISITQAYHRFSIDNPGLTMTYFMARSNYATKAFVSENVILEIKAACDLEVG